MNCESCGDVVSGPEGHASLIAWLRWGLRPDGEPHFVLYACSSCGSLWGRGRGRSGYSWQRKGAFACHGWQDCLVAIRSQAGPGIPPVAKCRNPCPPCRRASPDPTARMGSVAR